MNDHNLDDLIIDNIAPRNSKTKSFLTIVALLIVVLIIAIILTKIILKDPNADKLAFEENNTEIVSPELILQSVVESEPKKEDPELSNIIENAFKAPIPAPKVAKKEEVITEAVKEVQQISPEPEVKKEVNTKAKEEKLQQEYHEARRARIEKEKAEKEKIATEKAKQKKVAIKKEVPNVVKSVPPAIIEKAKKRPTGKPVNVPVKSKSTNSQNYYIQVGSFSKTPSRQFLSIIKNSGFNYKITPATSSGTKKLLIGPYKDRKSVDTALVRVRDRINKSAFVVKK